MAKSFRLRVMQGHITDRRCFYTGVFCRVYDRAQNYLTKSELQQSITVEHLIPVSHGIHLELFNQLQRTRNRVAATHFINTNLKSSTLGFKLLVRDQCRDLMRGKDDYSKSDLHDLRAILETLYKEYTVKGIAVWVSGNFFWRRGFNNDDFDLRAQKLNYLTSIENRYIKRRFYDEIGIPFNLPLKID